MCCKFHKKSIKIEFFKNFQIFHFFASAGATFVLNFSLQIIYRETQLFHRMTALIWHPRKWNKIQNRTYGAWSKIQFSNQKLEKCRRPSGWRFSQHRITLRAENESSCSTSHIHTCEDRCTKILQKLMSLNFRIS